LKSNNPFNHKYVEKVLFKTCKVGPLSGRKTRSFLRKQARYIEHAYEIGYADAVAGKELIPRKALPDLSNSPMGRKIVHMAYTAYQAGQQRGRQNKHECF